MKYKMKILLSIIILLLFLSTIFILTLKPKKQFIAIGTGSITGLYYPTGGALSSIINKNSSKHKLRVLVESTNGSVYNINAIMHGDLALGIVQADRQFQAYNGLAEWKMIGPQKKLRSILSIYPEAVTLVCTQQSGIKSVKDLIGTKVNLGNWGSGHLQNSKDILKAFDITVDSFQAAYVKAKSAPDLLKNNKIDAFFYTIGHPNNNIKEATKGKVKMRIIDISGPKITKLLAEHAYYSKARIPINYYPKVVNKKDVKTIGVKATFVTSTDVNNRIIYMITKEIFENLNEFKKLHQAYDNLSKQDMLKGLSAPIHKGALKYYKEAGLVKYINPKLLIVK
ncbi:TAXI family TRAP transporter solute-binding subunit [Candidatus Margulisiibacteriota bacterium]